MWTGILLPKLFWLTVKKKLDAVGREFAKFLRSLEQFIQVLVTECFFNISYNDKLEQLELNLGNRKS
mgnify:CR=1 FL=1